MKIKVCGITSSGQLQNLHDLGADYAGLIFFEGSKRYIGEKLKNQKAPINNCGINKVGVFVNADLNSVINAVNDYGLHAVQLHGDETAQYCMELMSYCKVIKVFPLFGNEDVDVIIEPFQNVCHYFLFDTKQRQTGAPIGGTGKKFNWTILQIARINKPFFLSGGIGLEDINAVRSFSHPFLYAIDINSRFETEPGVKDITRVAQFVNEVR